jgi:predicted DNA-binding transcriptional regulator YafY
MNHFDFLEKLSILNKLIRREHTGTPDELAERLSISRSLLYEIIDELNARGVDIKYSRTNCTFYYNNDVFLDVHFSIKSLTDIDDPEELKNISGGCKISSSFFLSENQYFKLYA